jgi:predicted nucleotidyltransferase
MNKRAAIAAISSHADEIRAMGVAHLYLFGSVARGEAKRGSDVDMFVDVRKGAFFSLIELIGLRDYLSELLHTKADVFTRGSLHRVIRRDVIREAVRVF